MGTFLNDPVRVTDDVQAGRRSGGPVKVRQWLQFRPEARHENGELEGVLELFNKTISNRTFVINYLTRSRSAPYKKISFLPSISPHLLLNNLHLLKFMAAPSQVHYTERDNHG